MDPRRRAAVALVVAGAALAIALHEAAPPDLETVLTQGARTPLGLAIARGPGYATLDNGTTLLSFECSHQNCKTAVRVDGDARDVANERAVLLHGGPWTTEPLSPEWALATGSGFVQNVSAVVSAPATIAPRWPFIAAGGVATAALAAGLALLSRKLPLATAIEAGATSLVGFGLVVKLQSLYQLETFIPVGMALVGALALSGIAFVIAKASGFGKLAGWGFLTFAVGLAMGEWLASPYYPACCSM